LSSGSKGTGGKGCVKFNLLVTACLTENGTGRGAEAMSLKNLKEIRISRSGNDFCRIAGRMRDGKGEAKI